MRHIGLFFIFALVIRYSICNATHRYATLRAACDCGQNDTDMFVINVDVEQDPIAMQLAYKTILYATFSKSERLYMIYLNAIPTIKIRPDCPKLTDETLAKRHCNRARSATSGSSKSYQGLFTGYYFFQFEAKYGNCKKCVSDRVFVNGSFDYQELTICHTYDLWLTNNRTKVDREIRVTVPSVEVALNVTLYSSRVYDSGNHDYENTSASPMQCIVSFTDPLDEKTDNIFCTGEVKVRRDTPLFEVPGAVSFIITSSEPRRPDYYYIIAYRWLDETGVIKTFQDNWRVSRVWQYNRHDSDINVGIRPTSQPDDGLSQWAKIIIAISSFGLIAMIGIALCCMLQKRLKKPELEGIGIATKGRGPRPGSLDVLFLYAKETQEFDMLVESVKEKLGQSSNLRIHDFQTLEGYAKISHLNLDDWIEDWFKNDTKIIWFDTPMLRCKLSKKQKFQQVHDSRDRLLRVALTWAKHYHVEPTTRHSRDFVVRITGCQEYEVSGESDTGNPLSIIGQHRYYYIPDHLRELYEAVSETEIVEIEVCPGPHSEHRRDISALLHQ